MPKPLHDFLKQAQRIVVFTGAGLSAESGVPTFRDAQTSLWTWYSLEDLATPEGFVKNPRLVWEWHVWLRKLIDSAHPNPAHRVIAWMEELLPEVTVITQNVDGLHQRAGSQNIIELHGNIQRTRCFNEGYVVGDWEKTEEIPPKCSVCGGYLRPDVVWYNEAIPEDAWLAASHSVRHCEVFITIGSSGLVYPATELCNLALASNAKVIQINPRVTPLDAHASINLRGKAGQIMPKWVLEIWGGQI
jgi:NAD-dependent deacetylase